MKSIEEKNILQDESKFCEAEAQILKLVGYDLEIITSLQFIRQFFDNYKQFGSQQEKAAVFEVV